MIKFWAGATACLVGLCAGYGLASRNSSGTYSTPNTFVAGTTISSTSMNANFSDLATEMTASLERSGKGGMLAALRGVDGTVAAPAFSWTSETGSGWYRIGSSDLGLAISGTKKLELTSSLFTVTPASTFTGNATFSGVALAANGAVGAPSYSFTNDATAGFYRSGSGDIRLAIGGADLVQAVANMINVSGGVNPRSNASPFPSSGKGLELVYSSVGDNSAIQSYDRTGAAWKPLTIDSSAITVNSTSAGTFKIGNGGTATSQLNFGSCTLNGASPSVCTATVLAGAKCVAIDVATTAATRCLATSVTTTTLTVTSCNGNTNAVNYVCF